MTELVDELGLEMPVWRDAEDRFTMVFDGFGVPMSVLIDRAGSVVHVWHGRIHTRTPEVTRLVDQVLQ